MYKEFLEANPDVKSRIEALTSGLLTPDLKGLALRTMNPEEVYTKKELYEQILDFYGLDELPITVEGVWQYYYKGPRHPGSLESIGAVVRLEVKEKGGKYVIAYQKTDAGRDFGDPLVDIGTYVVNKVEQPLWIILGFAGSSGEYRRGYIVHEIIKLLAKNPEDEFTATEITNELKLNDATISQALNHLGKYGLIDYNSPARDIKGERNKGWAVHELIKNKKLDEEDKIIQEAKKLRPYFSSRVGYLKKVIKYINSHPHETFEYNKLSKELGIPLADANACLSILSYLGYLRFEFKGSKVCSRAKANENTKILWEELFKKIERVAYSLDPYDSEFRERFEYYKTHLKEWKDAIKRQI
jgi:transcription initiation factor IIE alpha subunit